MKISLLKTNTDCQTWYFLGFFAATTLVSQVAYPVSETLSLSPAWSAEGNQVDCAFGFFSKSAGDVNGDGFDDIIVSAKDYDNGEEDEGKVFLYYGSADGPSQTADWTAEGNLLDAGFGYGVSTAGDVNGDGYDDVIIGAISYDVDGIDQAGKVFVYHGSETGLGDTADWVIDGENPYDSLGSHVSSAGDVNGDGYDDIILGSMSYNNAKGVAFVYHGSETGLSDSADWTMVNSMGGGFGGAVSSAGDVNGDGYDDVIIASVFYNNGENAEGAVFVYLGSPLGLEGAEHWMVEGNQENAALGAVSSAGDVNGDGYSDIIVGATKYDNGQIDEGRVYAFYGSVNGLSETADWMQEGNKTQAWFGKEVDTVGDVNNDGYDDVIVGSPFYSGSLSYSGAVFVYFGSETGLSPTVSWKKESPYSGARYGNCVSMAGDVNNDGADDFLVGANTYDNGQQDEGAAFLFNGVNDALTGWVLY